VAEWSKAAALKRKMGHSPQAKDEAAAVRAEAARSVSVIADLNRDIKASDRGVLETSLPRTYAILADSDAEVRDAALRAAGQIVRRVNTTANRKALADAVAALATDADTAVRARAAEVLGSMSGEESLAPLRTYLDDASPVARPLPVSRSPQ
jgi:HEAT repeat protein